MATTSIDNRPQLAPTVPSVLGGLRLRIRIYVWLQGLTSAVAWLGLAFWLSLGVDWCLESSPSIRRAIFALVAVVLAGLLMKLIVLRAFTRLSNSSMATVLERRFRQLDDSLLTAVVLTDQAHTSEKCDPAMLARTCREAEQRVRSLPLRHVFKTGPLLRSSIAAIVLAGGVLAFALSCPDAFGVWTKRNLLFSSELWPRKTSMSIEGFDADHPVKKVARGADFKIIALADMKKLVPESVEIRYTADGGSQKRIRMAELGDAAKTGESHQKFSHKFQSMLTSITFTVKGGDHRTPEYRIEVVDSPTIDDWVLHCKYPAYMGRATRDLPVTAAMQVPFGTDATIRAWSNKDLVEVYVDTGSESSSGTFPVPSLIDASWVDGYVKRLDEVITRQEKVVAETGRSTDQKRLAESQTAVAKAARKLTSTMVADLDRDLCHLRNQKRADAWVSSQINRMLEPDRLRMQADNDEKLDKLREQMQTSIEDEIKANRELARQKIEADLRRSRAAMREKFDADAKELHVTVEESPGVQTDAETNLDKKAIEEQLQVDQQSLRKRLESIADRQCGQVVGRMKAQIVESLKGKREAAKIQLDAIVQRDRQWVEEQLTAIRTRVDGAAEQMQQTKRPPAAGDATKKAVATRKRALGQLKAARRELERIPRGFQYPAGGIQDNLTLKLTLSDTDGITGREPMRLGLVPEPDVAPQLAVQFRGIGPAITPDARLPITGTINDDYGVAKTWFQYAVDPEQQTEVATRPITIPENFPTELELDDALEVRDLELKPGQTLVVSIMAADRYNLGANPAEPNVGTSDRWLKDIVTPEQLQALLEARELVLRQRFETIIEKVTETRNRLLKIDFDDPGANADNGKATDEGAEPGDEVVKTRSPVEQLELNTAYVQRALQDSRQYAHETGGVANAFDEISLELTNNRIGIQELIDRLEDGIAAPLHRIADDMFPELERRLEILEGKLSDKELGPERRNLARQQADAILLQMHHVLEKMTELEDFNEALELLRAIIQLQEEIGERAEQRQKDRIRELLED